MQNYAEYNKDESGLIGYAQQYFFPQNEDELLEIIEKAQLESIEITFQGGKTGIVGASIPFGGWLVNLSKMSSVVCMKEDYIEVEAGITLKYLTQYIRQKDNTLFFPINPTEELATIGGIIASNARALNAMQYGFIEDYISEITCINFDGKKEILSRNNPKIKEIVGSEGKKFCISKVRLSLLPKPKSIWGISFFFEEEESAYSFIEAIKVLSNDLLAVEFIDKNCINLLESKKKLSEKIKKVPDINPKFHALVYIEIAKDHEEEIEECVEKLIEKGAEHNTDSDSAWIFEGYDEVQRMRDFRHAILEFLLLNSYNFGFNLQIAGKNYGELVQFVYENLPNSEKYIFGHAENDILFCMFTENSKEEFDISLINLEKLFDLLYLNNLENVFFCEYGIGAKNIYFFEKYVLKKGLL